MRLVWSFYRAPAAAAVCCLASGRAAAAAGTFSRFSSRACSRNRRYTPRGARTRRLRPRGFTRSHAKCVQSIFCLVEDRGTLRTMRLPPRRRSLLRRECISCRRCCSKAASLSCWRNAPHGSGQPRGSLLSTGPPSLSVHPCGLQLPLPQASFTRPRRSAALYASALAAQSRRDGDSTTLRKACLARQRLKEAWRAATRSHLCCP